MKKLKQSLALVLVLCIVLGTIQLGNAAPPNPQAHNEIVKVNPQPLTGGYIHVVGQKTIVTYDAIANNMRLEVRFNVYIDPVAYEAFNSSNLGFVYDKTLLEFDGSRGYDNVNASNASEVGGVLVIPVVGEYLNIRPAADGYAGGFSLFFNLTDANRFKAIDPSTGINVAVETHRELSAIPHGGGVGDAIYVDEIGKNIGTPAILTYSSCTVTYDANGGTGTLPPATAYGLGAPVTIPDNITLTKDISGVPHVLSGWDVRTPLSSLGVKKPGETFNMPDANITMVAQYAPDKDGDGIADGDEYTVTYRLRANDEATLDFSAVTQHGNFYDVTAASGVIGVEKGDAIGNAVPAITATSPWKLVGYFVGGTKLADIATYVPTADTVIEIRTMPDDNGNDIDDRDKITLTFTDKGVVVETLEVPDGTPFTVFKNPDEDIADQGTASTNPTTVDLTGKSDPTDDKGNPFETWNVVPITNPGGDIIGVEVHPEYSESIDVVIPGPIIDKTEDPTNEDPSVGPVEKEMENGAYIIHRDIDGAELKRTEIDPDDVVSGKFSVVNPTPSAATPKLPAKDSDGNPFKAWELTGPVRETQPGGEVIVYYFMDPVYSEPVHLTVTDPGNPSDPTDDVVLTDEDVPKGTEYIVLDENGDPLKQGTINGDTDIVLPAVTDSPRRDELPFKNGDGEVFTGWNIDKVDNDGDGIPDVIIYEPVYELPDADDIEIIPFTPEGADAITGDGLYILRGKWHEETRASITILMRVCDAPATAADMKNMSFTNASAYGFEHHPNVFGSLDNATLRYQGTRTVDGKEYGEFAVTYSTLKSSVVRVTATYNARGGEKVTSGHVIITVGDNDKTARINASDYGQILRVINNIEPTPSKGSASAYVYELMNNDKNDRINASDYAVVLRMINGMVPTN